MGSGGRTKGCKCGGLKVGFQGQKGCIWECRPIQGLSCHARFLLSSGS